MCGITGYISTDSSSITDTSAIIGMLKIQKHRGPDDSGIRLFSLRTGESTEADTLKPQSLLPGFEGVLGFNRLSILDLSINGHQPMVSPDKKVLLTLNGEIYNAFDFKKELADSGYIFRSTSDTEVVLALYLKYGMDGMLARLNGMFAIVIADLRSREVLIARDRFGIKPMYYVSSGTKFAFSSELKSFFHIEGFSFKLKDEQIDEYLIFRNNLRGTLFREVQSLTPGHYISYKHEQGPEIRKFFDIENYSRSEGKTLKLQAYSELLENWLGKSVKSQLMSDVRLGCQLSGGIDSSLVTWLANRNSDKSNFEAVSIIFNDNRFSEEKYIDNVADRLNIVSHKFLLDSGYFLENIEKATWHLESPVNHPNTIAIYKLSQRAKEFVTVLLSGEGADEVFGGYTRFYDIAFPYHINRLMHEMRRNLRNPFEFTKYFDHESRAVLAASFMRPAIASQLKNDFNMNIACSGRKALYRKLKGSLFDRQVKYEMCSFLPDLLIRQDKMSMAHSIENRVPFLDNEIVENSFTIPEKYLLLRKSQEGYNTEKYLLKKITASTFGNDFAFRDKMGFGIPLREFFQDKNFFAYLKEKIIPGIQTRGLFNSQIISGWLKNLNTLKYFELEAFWVIIAFEIWASGFLDKFNENSHTRY